ncbi:hypothetical protein MKX01_038057, partial [Papaver californicum]
MESHMSKVTDLFIQVLSIPIFIHLNLDVEVRIVTIVTRVTRATKCSIFHYPLWMLKDHGISDSLIKEVRDMTR